MQSAVTVWYDGNCPICIREIAMMRKLDKRGAIDFVNAGDPDRALSCPIDRETLLARFHARENDKILSGAAAFAAMWRAIPLLRPLGLIAYIPGALWIMDKLYVQFLKLRPMLQRWISK